MSGSKVFCPGSGKFGLGSKIFGPYCPRAVRFLMDLSQPAAFTVNLSNLKKWMIKLSPIIINLRSYTKEVFELKLNMGLDFFL